MDIFTNVKVIIFDWSGVISYDQILIHAANNIIRARYNLPLQGFEEWLSVSHGNVIELLKAYGVKLDQEAAFHLHVETIALAHKEGHRAHVYPGAADFLELMAERHRVAVISSHPMQFLTQEAQEYGVTPHIETLRGSVPHKARAIQRFLEQNGLSNREVVYVGDTTSDIRHAREADVSIVSITGGYHTREALQKAAPDLLIDSLAELQPYLC